MFLSTNRRGQFVLRNKREQGNGSFFCPLYMLEIFVNVATRASSVATFRGIFGNRFFLKSENQGRFICLSLQHQGRGLQGRVDEQRATSSHGRWFAGCRRNRTKR